MNYTQWRTNRFPEQGATVLNPEGMSEEPVMMTVAEARDAVIALAEIRGYMLRKGPTYAQEFVLPRVDTALKAFRVDEAVRRMSEEVTGQR